MLQERSCVSLEAQYVLVCDPLTCSLMMFLALASTEYGSAWQSSGHRHHGDSKLWTSAAAVVIWHSDWLKL